MASFSMRPEPNSFISLYHLISPPLSPLSLSKFILKMNPHHCLTLRFRFCLILLLSTCLLPKAMGQDEGFHGSFTIEMREFKKGKERKDSPYRTRYHLEKDRFAIEPNLDEGEIIMIYDRNEKEITTKTMKDGEKSATISPMINISFGMDRNSDADEGGSVKATGREKTIEGYTCQEYRIEQDGDVTLAWLAPDLSIDLRNVADMVNIKNVQGAQTSGAAYGLEGTMLEAHTEEKGGKITRDFYLKNISPGAVPDEVFSLEGFEVMDLKNPFGN